MNQSHVLKRDTIILIIFLILLSIVIANGAVKGIILNAELPEYEQDVSLLAEIEFGKPEPPKWEPPTKCDSVRLTEQEWRKLDRFFATINRPTHNSLYATGDHYELYRMLSRDFGFKNLPNDATAIYNFADFILTCGY
jgi:hypothetical protein